ncbi:SRPBCC family protein [Nocardia sp. NPDC005978]|uniref:SRPBCC family protein n=1 Tax=Nocardia sp. NPDC005978 TaxID=3156725 RepID=UPI00339F0F3D
MFAVVLLALASLALFTGSTAASMLHRRAGIVRDTVLPLCRDDLKPLLRQTHSFRVTTRHHFAAEPSRVYAALEQGAFSWLPLTAGISYPTPARGVGAARSFSTYLFAATEQVLSDNPSEHLSTIGFRTSIPLLVHSYRQDYQLVPDATGTTVTWTLRGRPGILAFVPLRWTAPLVRPFTRLALARLSSRL